MFFQTLINRQAPIVFGHYRSPSSSGVRGQPQPSREEPPQPQWDKLGERIVADRCSSSFRRRRATGRIKCCLFSRHPVSSMSIFGALVFLLVYIVSKENNGIIKMFASASSSDSSTSGTSGTSNSGSSADGTRNFNQDSSAYFLLSTGGSICLYFPSNHSKMDLVSESVSKATHLEVAYASGSGSRDTSSSLNTTSPRFRLVRDRSAPLTVFWTDTVLNKIFSTSLGQRGSPNSPPSNLGDVGGVDGAWPDSSGVQEVVSRGLGSLRGLAVDWIGRHLYWVDGQYSRIEVSNYDGSWRTTLVDQIDHSQGLEIDPIEGLLFWTSETALPPAGAAGAPPGGRGQAVERCYLDGSGRTVLFRTSSSDSYSAGVGQTTPSIGVIAVDIRLKRLFWVNSRSSGLESSDYDGRGRLSLGTNKLLAQAVSLTVNRNDVFWAEAGKRLLIQASLSDRLESTETLTIGHPALYDFKLIGQKQNKEFFDRGVLPCSSSSSTDAHSETSGVCSHLCLRGEPPRRFSCVCPYSLQLADNRRTCQQHGSVLGYASREAEHHNVFFVDWENTRNWVFPPLKIPAQNVFGFAADPSKDAIFWIDQNRIRHQLLTGQTETVLQLDNFVPSCLALDWKSRNLYLFSRRRSGSGVSSSGSSRSVISVCKSTGSFLSHLIWRRMYTPRQVVVDAANRLLFWLHQHTLEGGGEDGRYHLLEFATLDGKERKVFLNTSQTIQSFVSDVSGKQLCWLYASSASAIVCRRYFGREQRVLSVADAGARAPPPPPPPGSNDDPSSSEISVMCSYNGNLLYADQLGSIKHLNLSRLHPPSSSSYAPPPPPPSGDFRVDSSSHSLCFLTVMDPKRVLVNYYLSGDNLEESLCIENKPRQIACQYQKASLPYLFYLSSSSTGVSVPTTFSLKDSSTPDLFPSPLFGLHHEIGGRGESGLLGGADNVDLLLDQVTETYFWISRDGQDGRRPHPLDPTHREQSLPRLRPRHTADEKNRFSWSIQSIRRDGKQRQTVLDHSDVELRGIAVDRIAGNIYWCVPSLGQIWVSRLNGDHPYVVLNDRLSRPNTLAIDPHRGLLFWSSCPPPSLPSGPSGSSVSAFPCRLESSSLFGQHRRVLLANSENVSSVGDLIVADGVLYWTNNDTRNIHALHLLETTMERETILPDSTFASSNRDGPSKGGHRPYSIAVYNNSIYWTDNDYLNGSLLKKSLSRPDHHRVEGEEEIVALRAIGDQLGKILIAAEPKDREEESLLRRNPCHLKNGGCQHLCLYTPHPLAPPLLSSSGKDPDVGEAGEAVNHCFCSFGKLDVNQDGGKCQSYSSFLSVAVGDRIESLKFEARDYSDPNPPSPLLRPDAELTKMTAMAYDPHRERIVFSDLYAPPYLFSVHPNGSGFQPEIKESFRLRLIEGLSFDEVHRVLFWTESGSPSIWSLQEGDQETELVALNKADKPRGIAVHSCTGFVFWSNWRRDSPRIQFASLGGGRFVDTFLSEGLHRPEALAILRDTLYWGDVVSQIKSSHWGDYDYDASASSDGSGQRAVEHKYFIESCHLKTMERKLLVSGWHRLPFSIVPLDTALLWTDRNSGVVCRTDLTLLNRANNRKKKEEINSSSPTSPSSFSFQDPNCLIVRDARHADAPPPLGLALIRTASSEPISGGGKGEGCTDSQLLHQSRFPGHPSSSFRSLDSPFDSPLEPPRTMTDQEKTADGHLQRDDNGQETRRTRIKTCIGSECDDEYDDDNDEPGSSHDGRHRRHFNADTLNSVRKALYCSLVLVSVGALLVLVLFVRRKRALKSQKKLRVVSSSSSFLSPPAPPSSDPRLHHQMSMSSSGGGSSSNNSRRSSCRRSPPQMGRCPPCPTSQLAAMQTQMQIQDGDGGTQTEQVLSSVVGGIVVCDGSQSCSAAADVAGMAKVNLSFEMDDVQLSGGDQLHLHHRGHGGRSSTFHFNDSSGKTHGGRFKEDERNVLLLEDDDDDEEEHDPYPHHNSSSA